MPTPEYAAALPFVLRWEGGFVDHPKDPGGRTNKGVTQRVYADWRTRAGLPAQDVQLITDEEVMAIYEADYWLPPRCNVLAPPLDLVQFDTAVNMGVGRAVRFLQTAVGCGVDGQFGSGTAQAVAGCDPRTTLARYCETREAFYRGLVAKNPDLGVFLKGWMNRLNSLRQQVGVPVFGFTLPPAGAEAAPMLRIPDIGENPDFDL